jgi:NADPH:quinone reductase-like Zn-dependent oxidoreductase
MKAVVLTDYGDVEKLELRDVPEPTVGPNEIKVRVAAASINPIDWKLRSGAVKARMPLQFPSILGRDVSGTVVAVGAGVTGFTPGARVMGLVQSGYAEFVVAGSDAWAAVPDTLDLVDAAALPLVLLTGAELLEEGVNPRAGDVVLVTGAVGGVGRSAVFAAKARGATVWAGVLGRQRAEAAKLGVAGVAALDDQGEVGRLPQLDSVADTIGGDTIQKIFAKLKSGGTVGSVVGEPPGAKERGLVVRAVFAHPDAKRLRELGQAVARGELVIPIAKKFPLAEVRAAQRLAETGPGGKVLLLV